MAINSDRELAEYLASSMRSQKLLAITDSISPDFVFFSPRVKAYNFEQYCRHLEGLSIYVEPKTLNVEQVGSLFIIDMAVQTIDIQQDYFHNAEIKMLITIIDHMVHSVEFEFESTPEEDAYMHAINPIDEAFKPD